MRLELFGGLRLEMPEGTPSGRATQPRRLAILALLALSRNRSLRRDEIVAYLSPDRREDVARRQLSKAVYDLRSLLGESALEGGSDTLTLRTDALEMDTVRFESAVRGSRWDEAIGLYRGDLLEGVDLGGSVELEHWIDERRQRFVSDYVLALEREAERLAATGESERAIECLSRLVDARPYEAPGVLRLMRALNALGDQTGAIERARLYQERLHRDLEAEADASVIALAEELRSRAGEPLPFHTPSAAPPPPASSDVAVSLSPARTTVGAASRTRTSWWLGAAAVIAATLAIGWRLSTPPGRQGPATIGLAIFPFAVVGDSQYRYLSDGMARLLSADLDGGGQPGTVHSAAVMTAIVGRGGAGAADMERLRHVAADMNAERFVTGTAIGTGDRLRLTAVVHSVAGRAGREREIAVEGPVGELVGLVDSLTSQLLVAEAQSPDRLVSVAAATARSIPALKAYLRGDRLFRGGDYAGAAAAFDQATKLDPTFAVAHYRCSIATLWADVPGTSTSEHDIEASRFASRLAPRDRELVLGYLAWRRGDAADAERRYRALWSQYPTDAEAGFQLAEVMIHYGPLTGHPIGSETRTLLQEVLRVDSTHRGARWHLALLDAAAGRGAAVAPEFDWLARNPVANADVRAVALRLRGKPLANDSIIRRAAPGQLWSVGWRLAVSLHDLTGAEEAFRLIPPHGGGDAELARLELATGQWVGTKDVLRPEQASLHLTLGTLDGLLVNQIFSPPPEQAAQLLQALNRTLAGMDQAGTSDALTRSKLLLAIGRLFLAVHDSAGTLAARDRLFKSGDTAAAHSLDAFLAARAGRTAEALRHLDAARRPAWFGLAMVDPYFGEQAERFLMAELLFKQDRLDESLRWYGTFGEFAIEDLPYLARAEQRRAEIFERLGRTAEAVESLKRAVGLWAHADPQVVPGVTEARRSFMRLGAATF